jgi:hypothetical protein
MKERDKKKKFRHWQLILVFFTSPLPIFVLYDVKLKAQSELCALLRKCLIAIYCTKWHSNFVENSQDGG